MKQGSHKQGTVQTQNKLENHKPLLQRVCHPFVSHTLAADRWGKQKETIKQCWLERQAGVLAHESSAIDKKKKKKTSSSRVLKVWEGYFEGVCREIFLSVRGAEIQKHVFEYIRSGKWRLLLRAGQRQESISQQQTGCDNIGLDRSEKTESEI